MPEIAAVGGIALRDGRLLLIKRGHAPSAGRWSLPGGRIEPGESERDALAREFLEETGLVVEVGALAGEVVRDGPGVTYRIRDFLVTPQSGTEAFGDDAVDIAWVPIGVLGGYRLAKGLLSALRSWGIVPPF
jgi:ADP-ribose pyrophosphatase YjhB (NUDIX family)